MDDSALITVRSFDEADLAPVQQLIRFTIDSSYTGVYPPRAIRFFRDIHSSDKILERHSAGEILVVEQNGAVIATGAIVGEEVCGVFVHPAFQNRGIGGKIMDRLESVARAGGHGTARLNVSLPSKGFYENRGYEVLESLSVDLGEGERLDYWTAEKRLEGE